ncbi:hypothetical protein [Roseobacter sp. SK209-2-6]|uniref:hypothetical protein n=1 Tax=Roseobacter sp. SK209-2-6 TaxID=388739 RepID=UPI00030B4C09|nr:hypothetical protein [Roseobacter sp. SK209-2-6]
MRKAIFSEEDIIKAGQALEKKLGRPVSAWEVFKEMGQRGKLSRFQEVWEAHAADKSAEAVQVTVLPTDVETRLETALTAFRDEFTSVLGGIVRELQEEHLRQTDLARRDHMNQEPVLLNKVEAMSGELEFMRNRVKELEKEAEEVTAAEAPSDAPAEPSAPAKAPVAAAKAAPKSPNRPVKNSQVKKTSRPAPPKPKPTQQQARAQA